MVLDVVHHLELSVLDWYKVTISEEHIISAGAIQGHCPDEVSWVELLKEQLKVCLCR